MRFYSYFLLFMLFIISSCNRNKIFLTDFNRFVSDVEINYVNFSDDDWSIKDKKFSELSERRYNKVRKKLSPEEITRANVLIGKYQSFKNDTFIKSIKKFISDIEMNFKDFSDEDWLRIDTSFTQLCEIRFEKIRNMMTPEEVSSINELKGRYRTLKMEKGIKDLKTDINDLIQQGKGVINKFLSDTVVDTKLRN